MLIECHECGAHVSDKAVECPQCGAPPRGAALAIERDGDRGKGGAATTGDKILCLVLWPAWFVVRFVGGRTGAGPYALGGLALTFFLNNMFPEGLFAAC